MAYQRINFKDQDVERPRTYAVTENDDNTITLADSFGEITEAGTLINATNMNHIEDGLASIGVTIYSANINYGIGEIVVDPDNSSTLFTSIKANNLNHPITDKDWWKATNLNNFLQYTQGGTFKGQEVVFVNSLDTNYPSEPTEHDDALWLYSTPVFPYVPLNAQTSGTSYDFANGGMVIATEQMNVTIGAGELSPLTFTNFVGVLPISMGSSVTTSKTAYFVGY